MRKIVSIVLFLASIGCNAQLLETRHLISITTGYGTLNGNADNLFFPSSITHSGFNLDAGYSRKIKPWLAGGLSVGYYQFSSPTESPDFAEVVTTGGAFFTAGPKVIIHSSFKKIGLFNRLRLGIALTPQFHYYTGERFVLIDNEIFPVNTGDAIPPIIEMDESSSGFGAKITPEINYRISQRIGVKLSYNLQFLSVFSGFDRERMISHSFGGGLVFTFGNYKQIFL